MKIAFTTNNSVHINAHFGSAQQIDVYEVTAEGSRFVEGFSFEGNLNQDGNEDKLEPKIKALKDCTIVYVVAIGGGAAARLIGKNITPIKAPSETAEIQDVLTRFVHTLNHNPPPWLRKALLKSQLSSQSESPFDNPFDNQLTNKFEDASETLVEEVIV
ncbi:MAG: nitrogen fixation protein NifX [Phormidesmis priestleyi Ana]|uniref:Nitrogen fixation protein NifX n=1 Tax=Phormidesmis priestleyi Ana TaxID=1666911 RepID=A0A0P7YUQ7_9CYAN|nr:MAG: nitrogen fixation protein NifX [Phormidesmis priestleyi Ana]